MAKLAVVELSLDVAKAKQVWEEFERFKAQLLEEKDRYKVEGKERLNRQGCAKLATVFSLSEPEPPQVITAPLNDKHIGFITVTALETPDGRRAYGVAGCSTTEIQAKNPKNRRAFHDAVAISHTRAKERAISDLVGGGEVTAEEFSPQAGETIEVDRDEPF